MLPTIKKTPSLNHLKRFHYHPGLPDPLQLVLRIPPIINLLRKTYLGRVKNRLDFPDENL
jgi:hypothetical protein